MLTVKRLSATTLTGLVLGVVCYFLARLAAPETGIPGPGIMTVILEKGVLGFAIGISALGLGWWLHGLVLGVVFTLPGAFGAVWAGFGWNGFGWSLVAGIVAGFLIELVATTMLKASVAPGPSPQPA